MLIEYLAKYIDKHVFLIVIYLIKEMPAFNLVSLRFYNNVTVEMV